MTTNLEDRAKRAAAAQAATLKPSAVFRSDRPLYVRELADNLIPGVTLADFKDDLDAADGNELRDGKTRPAKFCATYSSSALAVNNFAPFKAHPDALTIAGFGNFTAPPKFEGKCPNGLIEANGQPSRSPNLDLLAFSAGTVVAVESKFLEPLSTKKQELSPKYVAPFLGGHGKSPIAEPEWTEMYKRASRLAAYPKEKLPYTRLDAAQFVKHYLGLKVSYPQTKRVLVYLYWEPTNAGSIDAYKQHRREVEDFANRVTGCDTKFISISYRDLWSEWQATSTWPGMPEHLARLRARYSFAI
ncbi:MAG: hypothetical protein MUO39_06890 [Steroidobacteraceae bacterium]|nr:hypothetical protein [Steroidobacteraceae bacterium]